MDCRENYVLYYKYNTMTFVYALSGKNHLLRAYSAELINFSPKPDVEGYQLSH